MTGVSVRALKYADIPEVRDMIAALAAHHGDEATLTDAALMRLSLGQDSPLRLFVAEHAGALAGYSAICTFVQLQYGRQIADLHHLFVRPEVRRLGVGQALIAHARDWAREVDCAVLSVGTATENVEAHAFYERLGLSLRPAPGPRYAVRLDGHQGLEAATERDSVSANSSRIP